MAKQPTPLPALTAEDLLLILVHILLRNHGGHEDVVGRVDEQYATLARRIAKEEEER